MAPNTPTLKSTDQVNQLELIADVLSETRDEFRFFRTTSSGLVLLIGSFPGLENEWDEWNPFEYDAHAFDIMGFFNVSVHIYPAYVLASKRHDALRMEFAQVMDITEEMPVVRAARHAIVGVIYKALLAECEQYKPGEKA